MPTLDEVRLVDRVRKVISRGPLFWFTPYEIIQELLAEYGELYSDASITARLRDLRKIAYGNHTVNKQPRSGSRAFEYQLVELPAERQEAA